MNSHEGSEHRFDSKLSSVPAWPLWGPVASSLEQSRCEDLFVRVALRGKCKGHVEHLA